MWYREISQLLSELLEKICDTINIIWVIFTLDNLEGCTRQNVMLPFFDHFKVFHIYT